MTIEKYKKMTMEDYLSNIGGILGLWTGASTLSFIQLAVFLFQFFFPALDPAWKKKQAEMADKQVRITKKNL